MNRLPRLPGLLAWSAQPVLVGVVLWLALGGPRRDVHVPLIFHNDGLFYLAQAKATIDHGWWWTNPDIGAPFIHDGRLFPQNGNIDQLIVRLVGIVWPDAATAVTLAWAVMLMLGGAAASWCLRQLGVSRVGAWSAGVLFALSPVALYRNTAHFHLAPYLVPFAATAALWLAGTAPLDARWRERRGVLAGCVAVGFNTIYFAFFTAFMLLVGTFVGVVQTRLRTRLIAGTSALVAVVLATALNMAPTFAAWTHDGRPEGVRHLVADSEVYGLKLRHLVSPLPDHWLAPLRDWAARDRQADFPNETENTGARLGMIGAVGFLGLMIVLLMPRAAGTDAHADTLRDASRLTAAAVLLATVGGVGSLFSVLVSPDIRAYARIAPFIAFFSLAAVALVIDRLTRVRHTARLLVWIGLLALGAADQAVALRPVTDRTSAVSAEYRRLRFFVDQLEQRLPAGASVFQLPVRPYPLDAGVERLGTYDHFKPYLVSHQLRWSYPAQSATQVAWQDRIAAIAPEDLPRELAREGFAAILVDRFGYADNGTSLVERLQTSPAIAHQIGQTDRYLAFAISGP